MNNKRIPILFVALLVAVIGILAYFLGKQNGNIKVQNLATNEVIIKQIAELSSLEVQGVASIKQSNVQPDGGLISKMRDALMEQTLHLSIPYVAKYGVDLEAQKVVVEEKNKTVLITMPEPKLLSYELRLDKAQNSSKEGWLQSQSHDYYASVQKTLYEQTRKEMEESTKNKTLAQEKILNTLKNYYQPIGYTVKVQFGNTAAQTLNIDNLNSSLKTLPSP